LKDYSEAIEELHEIGLYKANEAWPGDSERWHRFSEEKWHERSLDEYKKS
jgi:hypothetical protein